MAENELRATVADHLTRTGVPGAVVGVLRGTDRIIASTGVTSVETGHPVTDDTPFPIGSITKPIVATTIVRLADQGLVDLDAAVSEHVPELSRSLWARAATIRDLLANRGRVPLRAAWEFDLDLDGADVLSRIAAMLSDADPFAPVWSYTNTGWCVLGRVVEVAMSETWEAATRSTVLDPMGMGGTTFHSERGPGPSPVGHQVTAEGATTMADWTPAAYAATGSSMGATAGDLLRFARAHLTDPTLATMREAHATTAIHGWLDAWCLGWARFDWEGGPVWGWDGNAGGFRAVLRVLPDHDAAVALLTNGTHGRSLYRTLFAEILQDGFGITMTPLSLTPMPTPGIDLEAYAGTYSWPDWRIQITAHGDHLVLATDTDQVVARPADRRVFVTDPANPDRPTVTFDAFDAQGRPGVLYHMLWGLPRRTDT